VANEFASRSRVGRARRHWLIRCPHKHFRRRTCEPRSGRRKCLCCVSTAESRHRSTRSPSTENRIEDRNSGVAAITERPEVALCLGYIPRRAVPRAVPPTGRRRAVPATRRRRALPIRRRATWSRAIVPAEPSLWRRRRRTMTKRAEPVGCIGRAAHPCITSIESSLRRVRPRPKLRSARSAGSRPLRRSAGSRSAKTRSAVLTKRGWLQRGGVGQHPAYRQC
jgi:hypothetical protein